MGRFNIPELIKKLIFEFKAQIMEKAQLSESGDVNIGGKHTHYHFPPETDLKKIADVIITPEFEDRIVNKAVDKINAQEKHLETMPDQEQLQTITDATSASIIEISHREIHGTIGFHGEIDAELVRADKKDLEKS